MADSKHTPGPWRVAPEFPDVILGSGGTGYQIRDMDWSHPRPVLVADMRLIAAAPDMLAALENVLSYLSEGDTLDPVHDGAWVHAAIAKAKGEPTS